MTEKLSQFTLASAVPSLTNTLAGADAGSPNLRYTLLQIKNATFLPILLTSNFICSVDPVNGNDVGIASGSVFKTLHYALDVVAFYDYGGQFTWEIDLADGSYPDAGALVIPQVKNPSEVCGNIFGNATTPGNVVFTNCGGFRFNPATYEVAIGGFRLNMNPATSACFLAANGGANPGAEGGFIFQENFTLDVTGTALTLFAAAAGALFDNAGAITTVTVLGTQAVQVLSSEAGSTNNWDGPLTMSFPVGFTMLNAFMFAQNSGAIVWSGMTVINPPGGFTGLIAHSSAALITDNGLASDIPGGIEAIDSTVIWRAVPSGKYSTVLAPSAGPPTTAIVPASPSFSFIKDVTNGPRSVAVNDGGVIYTKQISRNINLQAGNYTIALFDQDGRVEMNAAGANTLTVPTNATVAFPITTEILVTQVGAGATTVAAAGGVTGHNFGALAAQWASIKLYKRGTDEWIMTQA